MANKLALFFTNIFKRSTKEITLLIIGPPSCGKTALIYFLYRFATNHLTGKTQLEVPKVVDSTELLSANNLIREIELSAFVNMMTDQIAKTKDFIGTEPGTIDYINYDTGLLNLKIYNISGELFSQTGAHSEMLKSFAVHLDSANVRDVYCLLADEVKVDVPVNYNMDIFAVKAFFTKNGLPKASQIFDNVNKGINTLRVVTKFDRQYIPTVPAANLKLEKKEFAIYHRAIGLLNNGKYFGDHEISYTTPDPVTFRGSKSKELYIAFVCTGLYDRKNYTAELYEQTADGKKRSLKVDYWKDNGFNMLEMYGIIQIFTYILKNYRTTRKIKIIQAPSIGRNSKYDISVADYKKILGLK